MKKVTTALILNSSISAVCHHLSLQTINWLLMLVYKRIKEVFDAVCIAMHVCTCDSFAPIFGKAKIF